MDLAKRKREAERELEERQLEEQNLVNGHADGQMGEYVWEARNVVKRLRWRWHSLKTVEAGYVM